MPRVRSFVLKKHFWQTWLDFGFSQVHSGESAELNCQNALTLYNSQNTAGLSNVCYSPFCTKNQMKQKLMHLN